MPAETNRIVKEEKFRLGERKLLTDIGDQLSAGQEILKLLPKIENYSSTIPDAVLMDLMSSTGFSVNDPIVIRLMSLVAQKFLSSLTFDALQHCKVRTSNSSSKSHHGHSSNHVSSGGSSHRTERHILTMEDLTPALAENGITIKKPLYYE